MASPPRSARSDEPQAGEERPDGYVQWQDPFGLYTTIFVGIDPERGYFVGADPVLHSPTRFFISIEFKEEHVRRIEAAGRHTWERDRRGGDAGEAPVEVLVGGKAESFTRFVFFEREALAEDQGHRQLLAEKTLLVRRARGAHAVDISPVPLLPSRERLHALCREFEMSERQVLDLIAEAPRLKMAVRGWVAEEHLVRVLRRVRGVTDAQRIEGQGEVDVSLRYRGSRPISIQCKNVLRTTTREGLARLDFQRTRAAKSDPCSRYYTPKDFDVVAACLHAVSEKWDFAFALPTKLDPHKRCPGRLSSNVRIDDRWAMSAVDVFREVSPS